MNPEDVAAYFSHNKVDLMPLSSTVQKLLVDRGPFTPETTRTLQFLLEAAEQD
jgi:hypothetical protein